MFHNSLSRRTVLLCGALFALALVGCGDSDDPISPEGPALTALRQAVEPFHDFGTAEQAGYDNLVQHPTNGRFCLRDPELGAMGVHYLNTSLVDDTVLVTRPEVVIYEPHEDDSLDFVAVEYLIPFTIRGEDEPPPVLFGQQFVQNHTFNLWALHVWVGRDNPSGIFAPYNPDVTCEFINIE